MKKINVTNHKTGQTFSGFEERFASYDDLIAWKDEQIRIGAFGKPEREIVEFSESYDEADVKSRRSESVGEGVINYVTLRAEYEIIEKDLSQDYDWLLQECYRNRRSEYPTQDEIIEALMEKLGENRSEKFQELHDRRIAIKQKYPKPNKG